MFYTLSPQQIQQIKQRTFPQETDTVFLKNVVVNSIGTDNLIKIRYSFKDGLENDPTGTQVFKVFNNPQSQKYMRLKIFEIINTDMLKEVKNFIDIADLERIINNYGVQSQDLLPSFDFAGDKTNPDAHVRSRKYNDSIELSYDINFVLPRENIGYLTVGAIFYLDKQAYTSDQSIDSRFIDPNILFDKLLTYSLFKENKKVIDSRGLSVQDMRLVKSTFAETNFFTSLLDIITNDRQVVPRRAINVDLTKPFAKPDPSKILALPSLLRLADKQKKYFTDIYYSRNQDKSLGMSFSLDFEEIVKRNSSYYALLENTEFKKDLLQKCKVSFLKVMRREVSKRGSVYTPQLDTMVELVSSGEPTTSDMVLETTNDNGGLAEVKLNVNVPYKLRTFAVTDNKVFYQKPSLYQYGVELNITNGITEFLTDYSDSLLKNISALNEYLEETNKLIRPNVAANYEVTLNGSYDPQSNSFTPQFIDNFSKPRNLKPSFQSIVSDAAVDFLTTLKLFGLLRGNEEVMLDSIKFLLHPSHTNIESIIFFIQTYEMLVSMIKRKIENNYNASFLVQYWFTNEYVDTQIPINIGYNMITPDTFRGLGLVRAQSYTEKIYSDLNRYSINPNIDAAAYNDKQFSYLAADEVRSLNKTVSLKSLNENKDSISNLDFAELEIDIKNVNYYGAGIAIESVTAVKNDDVSLKQAKTAAKSVNLSKKMSFSVVNTNIEINDANIIKQAPQSIKNDKTNETYLMLSLSKAFDPKKEAFNQSIKAPLDTTNAKALVADGPIQVNLLLEDKCLLLKATDNYKKTLSLNSKFQFLFNTLHSVEIMEYESNTLKEKWTLLTKAKLNSLAINDLFLCRMVNYKERKLGIEGINEIQLPIYNRYFFIRREEADIQRVNIEPEPNTLRSYPGLKKDRIAMGLLPTVAEGDNAMARAAERLAQTTTAYENSFSTPPPPPPTKDPFSSARTNATTDPMKKETI